MIRTPATPAKVGDAKNFTAWVHEPKENINVALNCSHWPGVSEGDVFRVTHADGKDARGFLFVLLRDDGVAKPQLQFSIPRPVAEAFGVRNNAEVTITRVDKEAWSIDYVEFRFQDQYLGRNDMWRLGESLVGHAVYVGQEISFLGSIAAKIQALYVNGSKAAAGIITTTTKSVHRSLSAKVTIYIQVCKELWEFDNAGERYNERIVHSFLPALFEKWRDAGTNHIVTIVLVSRVYYDQSEIEYAAGPLRQDEDRNWYKDFYKVITDLEVLTEWRSTLVSLKDSFWAFQRDILLTHHYHRAAMDSSVTGLSEQVRLVGRLSYAHDGPILEAINMGLKSSELHYIDRSLSLTGSATIIITPGTGYFRVNKQLLRLTTTRLLDQGFGVDLVSLTKPPLHQSPIFSFRGLEPELLRKDRDGKTGSRAMDSLWGGDDGPSDWQGRERTTFWWEPFWMSASFWDRQMDQPFRQDRFVARAKMHEMQMMGLLDHDVLSSIEIPFLSDQESPFRRQDLPLTKAETDEFDTAIFEYKALSGRNRNSLASSGNSTVLASSWKNERRISTISTLSHRSSIKSTKFAPIEESPRIPLEELPDEGQESKEKMLSPALSNLALSASPSQSSIRSNLSGRSSATTRSNGGKSQPSGSQSYLKPSWLFNAFKSTPSQAQTTAAVAHAESSSSVKASRATISKASASGHHSSRRTLKTSQSKNTDSKPVSIQRSGSARSVLSRRMEEEGHAQRTITPLGTPPRDEVSFGKRRSTLSSITVPLSMSSPAIRINPSRADVPLSYHVYALARRWEHMSPQPWFKHEIKWKSMTTPGCLPLTVEHFPTTSELDSSYDVASYDFVVDPPDMRSFLVKPPTVTGPDIRHAWAMAIMRGMAAFRLSQGFQFVLGSKKSAEKLEKNALRRTTSFVGEDEMTPKPSGAAEVLRSSEPIYLSMSNEIHRISYATETIQVRRYVRRLPPSPPFEYQCLIWPKLGVGYTEWKTSFASHGLENYGWNRLDMLVAGYEPQFHESLRYWRTRFVVIPTAEPPSITTGPSGEKLNEEEVRLLGMDKLADIFTRLRWRAPGDDSNAPPVRFLPTDLNPAASVLDENLMAQLDHIHASGPLKKKTHSHRDISDMTLSSIAKAMREEDGVQIKDYRWHSNVYKESFTGWDFVSWLVREFRDVSTREQGAEWGVKLMQQGLFDHCRGKHGFLDGHYYYRLVGEYAVPSTPKTGWFRSRHPEDSNVRSGHYPSGVANPRAQKKKRLILSQSMVIDIDPNKKSDQAETVILHHDIMHNPATVFHFELHWIGTTPRLIEDQVRSWNRVIERYGLRLVEAYVTQIYDVRERNAFQSCFPVRLAVQAPVVPDLDKRVPEGTQTAHYFEYALLRQFGFILDIEAADLYPEHIDAIYSYRREPFKYSQFVHRSGVAFVQVVGGTQGFLFLTNRLMGPTRMGTSMKGINQKEQRPAEAAEEIRIKLAEFCSDREALLEFYDKELAQLGHARPAQEDPPPLNI
ncbi:hypothetical protein PUNSTDRAFT_114572 [Punctularia strigosozonata HHB-11173 SS5]|uniref:uncharacterized protein n=1 Tax=Punctularia strigosozonata (strain HHB-11173) TaxID=741275 RepID=UPI0004417B5D|nr:uncharacterized protein PUNSTDRAFT_114572 [Punctularia strigosozonata HHB-11173 SS5]EIN07073.1 hypothetical protein PUNSTDRAFT_114572 [Punctularia strigosozonata HHB-11173 SS5]